MKFEILTNISDYVHNGFWISLEAIYVRRFIELAQQRVSGQVSMELAPGYCPAIASKASEDSIALYNEQLVSMDVRRGYVPQDAGGFIAYPDIRTIRSAQAG